MAIYKKKTVWHNTPRHVSCIPRHHFIFFKRGKISPHASIIFKLENFSFFLSHFTISFLHSTGALNSWVIGGERDVCNLVHIYHCHPTPSPVTQLEATRTKMTMRWDPHLPRWGSTFPGSCTFFIFCTEISSKSLDFKEHSKYCKIE